MKKITILSSLTEQVKICEGSIGLAISLPSDFEIHRRGECVDLFQFINYSNEAMRSAAHLARKLLEAEPVSRGIQQLTIFEEIIADELHKNSCLIKVHDFLLRECYEIVEFQTHSWLSEGLINLTHLVDSSIKIIAPESRPGIFKKLFKRFIVDFSMDSIRSNFHMLLDRLDPFNRRVMFFNKIYKVKFQQNKVWFYTTAVTYTNIALVYEPLFPESFSYLVSSKLSGGKPLKERKRSFSSYYDYAEFKFIPSSNEINATASAIQQHILSVSLVGEEALCRDIFVQSNLFSTLLSRALAKGLFFSAVFENWVDKAQPAMLVVGNAGYELYALHKANAKRIPTVLLQHGMLGPYYAYLDYPVDYFIVRGKFWKSLLSINSQKRSIICNPVNEKIKKTAAVVKDSIIYISEPYRFAPLAIEADCSSILSTIIDAMSGSLKKLVIRVHPLENISDYQKMIGKVLKSFPMIDLEVKYSQGSGLDELLSRALAVIMNMSTICLDCIKYEIPIISYSWTQSWLLEGPYHAFHRANNLSHLHGLVKEAIDGNLQPYHGDVNYFLDFSSVEESELKMQALWKSISSFRDDLDSPFAC